MLQEQQSYDKYWRTKHRCAPIPGASQRPLLVLGTDPVQIRSATDASGFATAALAARSCGERALAADLLGFAQTAAENLINRLVRPEQTKGRRRKPCGYRSRVIYV
jgi:hypothetical protein